MRIPVRAVIFYIFLPALQSNDRLNPQSYLGLFCMKYYQAVRTQTISECNLLLLLNRLSYRGICAICDLDKDYAVYVQSATFLQPTIVSYDEILCLK